MPIAFRSFGRFVPERRLSNDDLSRSIETSDEWIRSHTGIGYRHIAEDGSAASDLALSAARDALEKAGRKPEELSLIILATTTPEYTGFPSTACVLQSKLGARNATALDISAACSGFIFAISIASAMLARDGGLALIVSAELLSRIVDWEDRNTAVLFGDGAGAAILETAEGPRDGGILLNIQHSYGSDFDALYVRNSGTGASAPQGAAKPSIAMDGRRVYNFAVTENAKLIVEACQRGGVEPGQVDWYVPHQANARIIQAAAKRLGLDEARFFVDIEEYANTSAASIPIALCDMEERGLLKRGQLILLLGFGAGLTSGACLFRY